MTRCLAALAGLLLAASLSAPAQAELHTPAPGACRSALPTYDGNIRTRPLAVQNEGTSNAFVTCAQQSDTTRFVEIAAIRLINTSAMPVSIECTMVDGYAEYGSNAYQTITTLVPANNSVFAIFRPVAPETTFNTVFQSFSCNLPPRTGIGRIAKDYD